MTKRHVALIEYGELDPAEVPADLQWRVDLALEVAREALELPQVRVVWVQPRDDGFTSGATHVDPRDLEGWADPRCPDRIYLRCDRPSSLVETLLHECRHLYQYRRPSRFKSRVARERDADQWAAMAMRLPLPARYQRR